VGAAGDKAGRIFKQVGAAVAYAAFFGAGHGVAADEIAFGVAGDFIAAGYNVAFGAADVGDGGAGLDGLDDRGQNLSHVADGGAEDDEVGILKPVGHVSGASGDGFLAEGFLKAG